MTLTEVVGRVADRLGSTKEVAWVFVQETIKEIVETLNYGEEVKIRGLGRLYWSPVVERTITLPGNKKKHCEAGFKLKFEPAYKLRHRRTTWQTKE